MVETGAETRRAFRGPRWALALLRVPLVAKVAGANLLIVAVAFVAALLVRGGARAGRDVFFIAGLALVGSFVVNVVLIVLALRPLQALETMAARVWSGQLDVRVNDSPLADARIARVGRTMNLLLDGLLADRMRTRQLATEVIGAGDRERAYIARELHDSVAQTLAALVMQVGAAARDCTDPRLAERLDTIRTLGTDSLEEVRLLAHTMYPRVLDDLGLVAALAHLARQATGSVPGSPVVSVSAPAAFDAGVVPPAIASVLYRVAQEAVNNAVRHAHAAAITLTVTLGACGAGVVTAGQCVSLEVRDDGSGFDVAEAERRRPGMGLFTMRERVLLVNGRFVITSVPGAGTRVSVHIPLGPEGLAVPPS
ncbi:MAG TPA: sensor histidine kinase [Gemmatimonadaceae bacterium]|nr:sensor histidine kinase [Gemmatimonadaceae bacterium]